MPPIAYLECSRCGARISPQSPQTVCTQCADQPAGSLYVRYDLSHLEGTSANEVIGTAIASEGSSTWTGMWRYQSVLPDVRPVTLGEGWTPMLRSKRYPGVFVKEEGRKPNRNLQSPWACARSDDGAALRIAETGGAFGRKCGRCSGCLCGGSGDRGPHLHAS